MEKQIIINQLLKFNPDFSNEEIEKGLSSFEIKVFKAKENILEIGDVSTQLFIAESSITRCFYKNGDGEEHTLWMKPEQTFMTEYKSFVNEEKSNFGLQFYEPTKVACISKENLQQLYASFNNWALFGISLIEQTHITLIDVFVNLLSNDATGNYQYIEYMFPRFIQVAPLKDIASMLQVSPVTLSRIRAGTQTKR